MQLDAGTQILPAEQTPMQHSLDEFTQPSPQTLRCASTNKQASSMAAANHVTSDANLARLFICMRQEPLMERLTFRCTANERHSS